MKNRVMLMLGLLCLGWGSTFAAEPKESSLEKFYGKIAAVDAGRKSVTVHNKKKQQDINFNWNDQTQVRRQKLPIQASALEVGHYVRVDYIQENNQFQAKEIVVRPAPFKKKDSTIP